MPNNTGYRINTKFKLISDDGQNLPLDVNGQFCYISGLPQAKVDISPSDPLYRVYNTDACPIEIILENNIITLTGYWNNPTLPWELQALSQHDVMSTVEITCSVYGSVSGTTELINVIIHPGSNSGTNSGTYDNFLSQDILSIEETPSVVPASDSYYYYLPQF